MLSVFTPTYNRARLLERTYRSLCYQSCQDFEWLIVDDGSTDNTALLAKQWIAEGIIDIRYIYKENGGLYTGYNTAYANAKGELVCCVDSDDYMPENAVETILDTWKERGGQDYAGVIGLDFDCHSGKPLGGFFPEAMTECYFLDLYIKRIHRADSKVALRTDLVRRVAPQTGFAGEKNFNPVYMQLQVCDTLPLLVVNENLCWVDYQTDGDSMSAGIYKQYMNSPRSFAKLRRLEMQLKRNTPAGRFRSAIHYASSCFIAREKKWLSSSPRPLLTAMAAPAGFLLSLFIRYKNRQHK